jgi:hypothetical protein
MFSRRRGMETKMIKQIQKRAVEFRNKKREMYLLNQLPRSHRIYVEEWDVKMTENGFVWKPRDLKKEPLSLDVFNKFIERMNGNSN